MKPPVFSYHVRKFFAKIPTWWLKFIFSRKKDFPKGLMGHLKAVLKCLRKFSPVLHNPSRSFHCSQNIVPLIAKPWAGGIKLWRTSKIVSRNPEFYRQSTKMINFSRQQAKSFLLTVQTLWQNFMLLFPKIFSPNNLPDILNSCLETQPKKNLRNCK